MPVAMKSKTQKTQSGLRSPCPIASSLDLIGDKWSLLVVRDLMRGKTTYGELVDSFEKIPTNILAERLRRLEAAGIITKAAYQERPVRYAYSLTERGAELGDILRALVKWGKRHIPGTRTYKESAPNSKRRHAWRRAQIEGA